MAKLQSIINEVLYEATEKNLKIFFKTDVFIQDFKEPEEEEEEEPVTTEPVITEPVAPIAQQPATVGSQVIAQEETEEKEKLLTEDIFKSKTEGIDTIKQEKAKTILTLDDLLEYLENQKDDEGNRILDELTVEIIKSLADATTEKVVSDILHKGDKCNVTLDYGFDEQDSIGFQISKNAGVDLATMIMRKDGDPMTGAFNLAVFNQTITGVFLKEIQ